MGDRTNVTLTVLTTQAEGIEKMLGFEAEQCDISTGFTCFEFYEVNYGNLSNLHRLRNAGIAFNSEWGHGSEYGPGTHWCRFYADGTCREQEVSDEYQNPPINKLMELIDKPDELRAFIVNHHDEVTAPSWDHQEEYGKIFRVKNLIKPPEFK